MSPGPCPRDGDLRGEGRRQRNAGTGSRPASPLSQTAPPPRLRRPAGRQRQAVPGGGSDPQAADLAQALPLPQPSDTPWAQRRVCSTAATTQAAAPATLHCLPDHRDHRLSPRKAVTTNGRRT
ncbi:hypothetical protein PAL_GLEAN10017713 [Pteropus alecto]|uniref:Uncharacterized protein n=1 Tax=Pteropus alecto TaxID=9402 RepID=L5KXM4_PTEAL|nr:hypothetical protein PAL_GLEAN10017713 [Pteropus alecto]